MAYYLAETICHARSTNGDQKAAFERECFQLILNIWKHRSYLSEPPLKHFNSILKALAILGNDNLSFYLSKSSGTKTHDEHWLTIAKHIDAAAHSLIKWCIAMSATTAIKKEKKWLKNKKLLALDPSQDIIIISEIIERTTLLQNTYKNELKNLDSKILYLIKSGKLLQKELHKQSRISSKIKDTPLKQECKSKHAQLNINIRRRQNN